MPVSHGMRFQEKNVCPLREWAAKLPHWGFYWLSQGAGYLLDRAAKRILDPGDWVLAYPEVEVRFLASTLGGMVVRYGQLRWETMAGMLSMPERATLEALIRQRTAPPKLIPRTDAMATLLAGAMGENRPRSGFLRLCVLLHCCAESVDEQLLLALRHQPPMYDAIERFNQLMANTLQDELLVKTIEDLARQCGCSVRHFNRLFRQHFGVSLHQKIIQLRIEKAKRLLLNSDAKIIDVAAESGVSNLGVFNTLFKRFCNTTPSQWRQQHQSHPARRLPYSQP